MNDRPSSHASHVTTEDPFEPVFNPDVYRRQEGFHALDDASLERHFHAHGIAEGRLGADNSLRENFVSLASVYDTILEIGPFCNPLITDPKVRYFDVLDSAALEARAKEVGYPIVEIPKIDYVSPSGDLSIVDETFDLVISSHCVEHQPDLIGHLNAVAEILADGGHYFLLIPNKKYCFDYFIDQSRLEEICSAHADRRRTHSLASVIEHRALITHNDCARHWVGDHADGDYFTGRTEAIRKAIEEYDTSDGAYIDVHAWQFTPQSFELIIAMLKELSLISLEPVRVYNTPRGRNEFTAILAKR
ncbi:methyltransferase domain-containing protein [Fulvimarina sp. 2208YS6-2-32]|uniref:Methyltransferase domain-containing protein n=1 Tax=Fulvimarina uroteuthidis TaxID=3098149 RepID=A0ABU5I0G3_9HYPH|nr:methyltransferase domain-containing protein [Fulvimarina sp. 2208YS6-2-32]MDY8108870.1 methyltransferase domain-containing protein [Fulvimarina sp. 2208YS6-2-32]